MNVKVHNEKEVTKEFIVDEAIVIFNKCLTEIKSKGIAPGTPAEENLFKKMREEHKEFSTSYPIVLRYMIQMRSFHPRALYKYLLKIEKHPWKSVEEYLDSHADYIALLYKETTPHYNPKEVNTLRDNMRKAFRSEHELAKDYHEKIKKEVEEQDERLKEANKAELLDFIKKLNSRDNSDLNPEFVELLKDTTQ